MDYKTAWEHLAIALGQLKEAYNSPQGDGRPYRDQAAMRAAIQAMQQILKQHPPRKTSPGIRTKPRPNPSVWKEMLDWALPFNPDPEEQCVWPYEQ